MTTYSKLTLFVSSLLALLVPTGFSTENDTTKENSRGYISEALWLGVEQLKQSARLFQLYRSRVIRCWIDASFKPDLTCRYTTGGNPFNKQGYIDVTLLER
jgi:hypothetical protein